MLSFTLIVALSATASSQPTTADRTQARTYFRAGVTAYERRDWPAALEAFQHAYRLAPHPSVRVNMANCYLELRRPAEATFHFERFLTESPEAPAAQRAAVERQLSALRQAIGRVTLTVTPASTPGLQLMLDGRPSETATSIIVAPGMHIIEATADGFTPLRREVQISPGTTLPIDLRLEPVVPPPAVAEVTPPTATQTPIAPPPSAAPPTPAPTLAPPTVTTSVNAFSARTAHQRRRGLRPGAFYIVAGITGAAAIGWVTFGALALSTQSDFDATVVQVRTASGDTSALHARGVDQAHRAQTFALLSDIAMGLTLAGAVTSVVLFFKTDFRPRVEVLASALDGGALLGLGGTF